VGSHDLPVDFRQYQTLLEVSEAICGHRDVRTILQELSKRLHTLAQFEFTGGLWVRLDLLTLELVVFVEPARF
jgi:hypothetical protein